MVNKVILIGNLGQDPEAPRKTPSGTSVVDISIATVRRNKNGENSTDWHTVTCWGKTAEIVHQYLKKGRQVYIEGRLQYDSWQDKETGKTRKKAKIVAENVQFLGNKNDSGGGGNSFASSKPSSSDFGGGGGGDFGDDGGSIPF
jgi:single-strand DNA-binding protein